LRGGLARPCIAFRLPAEAVSRYGGFVELLLSVRGLTRWPERQTTDRPDAELIRFTALRFERVEATAAAGLSSPSN
jgi:hypothetical protein